MICQAHVANDAFPAWNHFSPWCNNKAVTTIAVSLITHERLAEVWLCQEHLDEYKSHYEP